jgi:hypothetical protein
VLIRLKQIASQLGARLMAHENFMNFIQGRRKKNVPTNENEKREGNF